MAWDASPIGLPALDQVLCLAAGVLAGTASLACGTTLAARRLSGSIDRLPGPVGLLAVCGTGILLIAISDVAARLSTAARPSGSQPGMGGRVAAFASRVGLVIALAAVAAPSFDSHDAAAGFPWGRAAATLAAVTAAAVAVFGPLASGLGTTMLDPQGHRTIARPPTAASRAMKVDAGPDADVRADAADAFPGRLLQRFERYALPDQSDCVRGRLSLTVPAGARAAHGHVGFCPPFAETPMVDVTTDCDDIEAVVSAAEVLPWGVRVECRLDEAAEEAIDIPVDLVARSPAVRPLPSQ